MTTTGKKTASKLPAAGVLLAILCGALAAACTPPDCGCELPMYEAATDAN